MNTIFADHIGTLIEVYIDDMLVKTTEDEKLLSNLETIFGCLCKYQMRLNSQKCAFAIEARKFLGFMLTHQRIEANPDKCQAILDMKSLTSIKEVQHLTRRIAFFSRFLMTSAWKVLTFFALLRKENNFERVGM